MPAANRLPTHRQLARLPDPSAQVRVGPAQIGTGLFARRAFSPSEPILHIAGRIVHYEVLWARGGKFLDNCIRFGPETYLDPGDNVGRYVNHSCEPNTAIHKSRNRLYLVASRAVRRGEELTFDYSTTIGDDDVWTMRCACGTSTCRRRIRRFGALPEIVQRSYRDAGMVPRFILETLGARLER